MKDDLFDIARTWTVNGTVFGVVTYAQIKEGMSFLLLALTLAWTIKKLLSKEKS